MAAPRGAGRPSPFLAKCGSACRREPRFHQIFKATRAPKPLRVTGLGIFSFFLFLLPDKNADAPRPPAPNCAPGGVPSGQGALLPGHHLADSRGHCLWHIPEESES